MQTFHPGALRKYAQDLAGIAANAGQRRGHALDVYDDTDHIQRHPAFSDDFIPGSGRPSRRA